MTFIQIDLQDSLRKVDLMTSIQIDRKDSLRKVDFNRKYKLQGKLIDKTMNEAQPSSQQNSQVKFVYLQCNKQKVSNLVSSYNRSTVFALIFSIFFAVYQLQKHFAIYFRPYYQPQNLLLKRQLQYHSFNLHTFYAFMTLKVALAILYKAWKIRRENSLVQGDLDVFRKQSTQVQDYVYFNLLLVCLTLVRLFQAGLLPILFDFVGSAAGIFLGKLLEKERSQILHYSTQLRQESID